MTLDTRGMVENHWDWKGDSDGSHQWEQIQAAAIVDIARSLHRLEGTHRRLLDFMDQPGVRMALRELAHQMNIRRHRRLQKRKAAKARRTA